MGVAIMYKKKINIFLPIIGQSGGIDVVYKYIDMFVAKGYDVVVYKEIYCHNMHRYNSNIKNKLHQLYCTIKAFLFKDRFKHNTDIFVWKINNSTVRDADVIIATAWPTAYAVINLAIEKGDKFYFIQDYETWDNIEYVQNTYKLPMKKIVVSTYINQKLRNNLGLGPFPLVYNGIDSTIFCDKKIRNPEKKVFLMLNHTLEKKGVIYGLQAFEKIKGIYPDAELKMFGTCNNSNLPKYVQYYQNPSRNQLVKLYSESNYFIFPSLEEGWGLTPLEAMACGCIVFGTNTGFVLDIGQHEKNMMVSEIGDVDGMVNNIEFILNNSYLEDTIRTNGKITIANLDWNKSFNTLLCLLERAK